PDLPMIAANPAAYYHGLFSTRYGDCEGVVLKDANLFNWYKWKPVKTIDVVITDFTEGDGKYLGYIGSLKVSVYDERGSLIEIANVSGMTDLERDEITDLATNGGLLGRVCEVKYQYVGSGGRLRHPRFKCWREDKPAGECKTSQDPELIAYLTADGVIT